MKNPSFAQKPAPNKIPPTIKPTMPPTDFQFMRQALSIPYSQNQLNSFPLPHMTVPSVPPANQFMVYPQMQINTSSNVFFQNGIGPACVNQPQLNYSPLSSFRPYCPLTLPEMGPFNIHTPPKTNFSTEQRSPSATNDAPVPVPVSSTAQNASIVLLTA